MFSSTHHTSVATPAAMASVVALASAAIFMTTATAVAATPAASAAAKPKSKTVATYARGGQLSAQGDTVAFIRIADDGKHAALLVGTGSSAPEAVEGAGGDIPVWAIPHVGTSPSGAVNVVYPRCATAKVTSCDLYSWDVGAAKERAVGAGTASTGETEGVYDRGALVYSRWYGTKTPSALVVGQQAFERTTLFYKPAGGKTRRLSKLGGRQLALHGSWIAQVVDSTLPDSGGICGISTVELVKTDGRSVRSLRSTTCGLDGSESVGPAFVGRSLMFGVTMFPDDGKLYRYDLVSGTMFEIRRPHGFVGLAPTSGTTAWTLRRNVSTDPESWDLERFTGLATSAVHSA